MNEPPTKHIPKDEWDPLRDLSNRVAIVEGKQIKQGDQLLELTQLVLDIQIKTNQVNHAAAQDTVERLDQALDEIQAQREALIQRKLKSTDITEQMMFELLDDNLQQRESRTRQERDHAIFVREQAKDILKDTHDRIDKLPLRPENALALPPVEQQKKSIADRFVAWLMEKYGVIILSGVAVFIFEAIIEYLKAKVRSWTVP
jgi:hypothetical protein